MKQLELRVRLAFMDQFREKITREGCKVINVIELIRCQVILFIVDVPFEKEELIIDLAFMTFIKNPEFQKYYSITPELLIQIEKDDSQFVFEKANSSQKEPVNNQTFLRLKKELWHCEFDTVLKKPLGFCTILPNNVAEYDSASDSYVFQPVEGKHFYAEYVKERDSWYYRSKRITPRYKRKFFFREVHQWFCEKIEFEFSPTINFQS